MALIGCGIHNNIHLIIIIYYTIFYQCQMGSATYDVTPWSHVSTQSSVTMTTPPDVKVQHDTRATSIGYRRVGTKISFLLLLVSICDVHSSFC